MQKQLKTLSLIEPDARFRTRSKQIICALSQERPAARFYFFKPVWVSACAVLIAIIGTSLYLVGTQNQTPPGYSSLSAEKLHTELQGLTIAVEVDNLEYHQTVNRTVAYALEEINNDRTRHLDKSVLKAEEEKLNLGDEGVKTNIDALLDTVIN